MLLRKLMARLATTILIFGTIRNALDHSHHKNTKLSQRQTGVADIDAGNAELAK